MLYLIARAAFRLLFRIVFRFRVIGREKVPAAGGVLLVANHASALDPPLLGSAMTRPVHFMAKAELFKIPLLKQALPRVHAFPVRRGAADRAAIRTAVERLKAGHVVGLFPEGTRSLDGELLPLQRGAALIALKAGVPIIPVALKDTHRPIGWKGLLPRVSRFVVEVGDPIELPHEADAGREVLNEVVRRMVDEIQKLLRAE